MYKYLKKLILVFEICLWNWGNTWYKLAPVYTCAIYEDCYILVLPKQLVLLNLYATIGTTSQGNMWLMFRIKYTFVSIYLINTIDNKADLSIHIWKSRWFHFRHLGKEGYRDYVVNLSMALWFPFDYAVTNYHIVVKICLRLVIK